MSYNEAARCAAINSMRKPLAERPKTSVEYQALKADHDASLQREAAEKNREFQANKGLEEQGLAFKAIRNANGQVKQVLISQATGEVINDLAQYAKSQVEVPEKKPSRVRAWVSAWFFRHRRSAREMGKGILQITTGILVLVGLGFGVSLWFNGPIWADESKRNLRLYRNPANAEAEFNSEFGSQKRKTPVKKAEHRGIEIAPNGRKILHINHATKEEIVEWLEEQEQFKAEEKPKPKSKPTLPKDAALDEIPSDYRIIRKADRYGDGQAMAARITADGRIIMRGVGLTKTTSEAKAPSSPRKKQIEKVNINTADAAELDRVLPGVGPAMAERIVAHREKHGRFTSPDKIDNVKGVGPSKLEDMLPHVEI